jgi:hypothetical protein
MFALGGHGNFSFGILIDWFSGVDKGIDLDSNGITPTGWS